jgi:hypothetical protein
MDPPRYPLWAAFVGNDSLRLRQLEWGFRKSASNLVKIDSRAYDPNWPFRKHYVALVTVLDRLSGPRETGAVPRASAISSTWGPGEGRDAPAQLLGVAARLTTEKLVHQINVLLGDFIRRPARSYNELFGRVQGRLLSALSAAGRS